GGRRGRSGGGGGGGGASRGIEPASDRAHELTAAKKLVFVEGDRRRESRVSFRQGRRFPSGPSVTNAATRLTGSRVPWCDARALRVLHGERHDLPRMDHSRSGPARRGTRPRSGYGQGPSRLAGQGCYPQEPAR